MELWLNYPTDGPPEQSQLFHRDAVDLQLVKVFIYLSDVDERSGPFTYIPETQPFGAKAFAGQKLEHKKRRSDDQIARVFPEESWRVCTGPPYTMILADTVGYHRGGKPITGRRILITFTYTSGAPIIDGMLSVRGTPPWSLSGIQKSALRRSLERPPARRRRRSRRNRLRPPRALFCSKRYLTVGAAAGCSAFGTRLETAGIVLRYA